MNQVHKTLKEFPLADQAAALIASSVEEEGGPKENISLGNLFKAALKGKETGGSTQQIMSNAINKGGKGGDKKVAQVFQELEKSLEESPSKVTPKIESKRKDAGLTEENLSVQKSTETRIENKERRTKRPDLKGTTTRGGSPDGDGTSSSSGSNSYSSSGGTITSSSGGGGYSSSSSSSRSNGSGYSNKGSGGSSPSGGKSPSGGGDEKGMSLAEKKETPHDSPAPDEPASPTPRGPHAAAGAASGDTDDSAASPTVTLHLQTTMAVILVILVCSITAFIK